MVLIMWLCRKMVIPHMTTFDSEGSKELIQGMDFHKKKFEEGIEYIIHSFVKGSKMTVTKVSVQDQQGLESAYSDPKTKPKYVQMR